MSGCFAGVFLYACGRPEALAIAEVVTAAGLRRIPCFVDEGYLVDADVTFGDSVDHELLASLAPIAGQAGDFLNGDIDFVGIRDAGAGELVFDGRKAV